MKTVLSLGFLAAAVLLATPPTLAQQPCTGDPLCIVAQERAKFGEPIGEGNVPTLLRAIASRLNAEGVPGAPFGILVKTTGENCRGYSCDIICRGNGAEQRQWDVLVASTTPAWNAVDPATQTVRFCEIGAVGPPPPPPPPNCAACETALVEARSRISALEGELHVTQDERTAALERALAAERRVEELLARPPATCQLTGPGWVRSLFGISCKVVQ